MRDLDRRWETDVVAEQPDWLSVKIGINDVWRTVAGRLDEAVPLDEYRTTYRPLLQRARARDVRPADPDGPLRHRRRRSATWPRAGHVPGRGAAALP